MTKRDLSTNLRTAQAAYDEADRRVADARDAERSASRAYDERRRRAPMGIQTERARSAWALTLADWTTALVAREAARDRVRAERRGVDETAMNALMGTERPVAYEDDHGGVR